MQDMGLFDFFRGKNKEQDSAPVDEGRLEAARLANAIYNDDPPEAKRMQYDSEELFYAAYNGDFFLVMSLLEDGANPNVRVHGYPAIYYPVLNSDNAVCFALLDHGADPNIEYPGGLFPIYAAAEVGNLELVAKLLACGAEIDKKTPKGCTALRNAAEEGHYETVQYLLANGADAYSVNTAGYTIIEAAERHGQYYVADLLREHCAMNPPTPEALQARAETVQQPRNEAQEAFDRWQMFKLDTQYRSSMLTMGIVEDNPRLVAQGLANGEDPNRRYSYEVDSDSMTTPNSVKIITPIVQASFQGCMENVRLLIENGADPNLAQKNGETALMDAVNTGNFELTEYLLENGADPNLQTRAGTALAFADGAAIMEVLLKHGANPNIPDSDGDLPIIGSIDTRRMDEVELLIRYGTDMNFANNRGQTPLDRAAIRGIGSEVRSLMS